MPEPTRDEDEKPIRLHIYVPQEEIDAIDDWSFANRVRARSKAIRELVKIGLEASRESSSE